MLGFFNKHVHFNNNNNKKFHADSCKYQCEVACHKQLQYIRLKFLLSSEITSHEAQAERDGEQRQKHSKARASLFERKRYVG